LLDVIAKRKQFIDQSLADGKNDAQQAEEQRNLYENRQKLWEQEKASRFLLRLISNSTPREAYKWRNWTPILSRKGKN